MNDSDRILINYVQREINSGKKKIIIPVYLAQNISEEAIIEIRRLCRLNGVVIEIEG